MNKELWIDRAFTVEIVGLTLSVPVQAGVTISHDTFAYHNGLGDLASGGSVSVEIDSLIIDWDNTDVVDDRDMLNPCKPRHALRPEIKREIEHQIEAFAEAMAAKGIE